MNSSPEKKHKEDKEAQAHSTTEKSRAGKKKSPGKHEMEHSDASNGIVKLNIGGTKYLTTVSTLTRHENSFFSSLLNGRIPTLKDDEGYYFIDRNGKIFEPILDYLRTGRLSIPRSMSYEDVQVEAEFYCIDILESRGARVRAPKWVPIYPMIELGPLLMTSGNSSTVFSIPKQIIPENSEEVLVYLYVKIQAVRESEREVILRIFTLDTTGREYSFYIFSQNHTTAASGVVFNSYNSSNFWLPITPDNKIRAEVVFPTDQTAVKFITSQVFLTGFR